MHASTPSPTARAPNAAAAGQHPCSKPTTTWCWQATTAAAPPEHGHLLALPLKRVACCSQSQTPSSRMARAHPGAHRPITTHRPCVSSGIDCHINGHFVAWACHAQAWPTLPYQSSTGALTGRASPRASTATWPRARPPQRPCCPASAPGPGTPRQWASCSFRWGGVWVGAHVGRRRTSTAGGGLLIVAWRGCKAGLPHLPAVGTVGVKYIGGFRASMAVGVL